MTPLRQAFVPSEVRWRPKVTLAALVVLGSAFFLAGCETPGGGHAASGSASRKPSIPYNLSGYSAAFKEGYADACAAPRRRNADRFKGDVDYSMGWNDGQSACRDR